MNNTTSTPRDIFKDIAKDLAVNNKVKSLLSPGTRSLPEAEPPSGYEAREKLIKAFGADGAALADSMELPKKDAVDRVSPGAKEIADLTGLSANEAERVLQSNPANVESKTPNSDSGTSFSI